MNSKSRSPWAWVPSLYFAQGLPYVAVMTIAVIMYKRLGLSNSEIALYTSWLYLPWVIKPLWSPFVDLIKTKRLWVTLMQSLVAVGFAGVAFFIPTESWVQMTLAFFWLMAFSSATHDIAADGFYMLGLTEGEQALFVGIRNTFYRFATIFGQGILVMIAGYLESGSVLPSVVQGNNATAWSLCFYLLAVIFIILTVYHILILPRPDSDVSRENVTPGKLMKDFGSTFVTFFQKNNIGLILFFILSYRLGESQLVKIASPFLLDTAEAGGLALTTQQVGLVYGTIGVIGLLVGGIIGGICISRGGLKKWILPMAFAINLPDLLYVLLAYTQTDSFPLVIGCVACEQLGYGFGFTAFTMYLVYVAQGLFKTAHYSIGTGLMALGMMIPGMIAGYLQEWTGYPVFFVIVCILTIPGIFASYLVMKKLPADFGKMDKSK